MKKRDGSTSMARTLAVFLLAVLIAKAWAGSTTTNLGLYKPDYRERNWHALVNANWDTLDSNIAYGAASSTDNEVPRFHLTTGKVLQTSGVFIDDSQNITGVASITVSGNVDGVDVSAHADRHEDTGADEIDGEALDVQHTPSNYTATAATLAGHLTGIDNALASGTDTIGLKILSDTDAIGDWIAITQTTYTNVDVSDDGCATTDTAALIRHEVIPTATATLSARRDGSSVTGAANYKSAIFTTGPGAYQEFVVPLASGIFEARYESSGVSGTNNAYVVGCFE